MIIKCKANNEIFNINGENIFNDVPPLNINDRTYLPIRFIAEQMGMYVDYNATTQIVTISDIKSRFNTLDEAAIDFGMYANCASIARFQEFGAYAYQDRDGYYWDDVALGTPEQQQVIIDATKARKCCAILHTHGGTAGGASCNNFSTGDKKTARKYKKPMFMCSPVGDQWRFDYDKGNGGSVTHIATAPIDWKHEAFCTSVGSVDYNSSKEVFLKYFNGQYKPIADHIKQGYIFDYYNQMFLNGDLY